MAKNMAPMHQNKMQRHPHNTDAGYTTTLAPGMLVPMYYDILSPGDSVYYGTKAFCRFREIVTAFLGEVDLHLDYFFVPLQMMYTPFGQLFAQTNDYISDQFITQYQDNLDTPDDFPYLSVNNYLLQTGLGGGTANQKECYGKSQARLLDALGLNPLGIFYNQTRPDDVQEWVAPFLTKNPNITPWLPCAYQAIYNKYFRNDNLERLDLGSYNFDIGYQNRQLPVTRNWFKLRYVQRLSDYFTDVKVSPLFSAVNMFYHNNTSVVAGGDSRPSDVLQKVRQWLVGSNSYVSYDDNNNFNLVDAVASLSDDDSYASNRLLVNQGMVRAGSVSDNIDSFASAAGIRTLFAVDKFLRVYGRAGKTYDDQILAHFGYDVPHDVKHDITHLKHYRFVLQAEPVFSNSSTPDGSQLGQVGGQGFASFDSGKDKEKFTAPVHGVFMCVAHAITKPRYFGTFDKLNLCSNRLDFPIPEFDKLGMQPMWAFEAYPAFLFTDNTLKVGPDNRLGWQYRYNQFKRKYNRVSLAFQTSLVCYEADDYVYRRSGVNAFNPWVLSKFPFQMIEDDFRQFNEESDFDNFEVLQPDALFEVPTSLNNVMVTPYDEFWHKEYWASPWLMFQTDPLIFDYYCDAKKVSWMSPTGEPDL